MVAVFVDIVGGDRGSVRGFPEVSLSLIVVVVVVWSEERMRKGFLGVCLVRVNGGKGNEKRVSSVYN